MFGATLKVCRSDDHFNPNFTMKLFPTTEQQFRLFNSQFETLERLSSRTERSEKLTSQITDKTFRGRINGNEFTLISSAIGKGAFCVMTGSINAVDGSVKVEINSMFQVLLSIILFLPAVGIIATTITKPENFSPIILLVGVGIIVIIRYVVIELVFRLLARESLNRLRDVIGIEWI